MGTANKALIAAVVGAALIALAQGGKVMSDIVCKIVNN
jgi:hypothetical protein